MQQPKTACLSYQCVFVDQFIHEQLRLVFTKSIKTALSLLFLHAAAKNCFMTEKNLVAKCLSLMIITSYFVKA